LTVEQWEIEPERIMSPNKQMELQIGEWLMNHRDKYDPEAQREILREVTLGVTDDPAKADRWVPDQPHISNSVHDAQLTFGSLMAGGIVAPKPGLNEVEFIPAMLASLAHVVQGVEQSGGMPDAQTLAGMENVVEHIGEHIKILAQDETNKSIVKGFADQLGKISNLLKGYMQRLQEANQKQQQQNGGLKPEDKAKIQAMQLQAKVKADNSKTSHAQKTAQRQISWEMKTKQEQEQHTLDMAKEAQKIALESARSRLKSVEE